MKLSDAVKVYAGSSEAAKVMLGSAEAWSASAGSPGSATVGMTGLHYYNINDTDWLTGYAYLGTQAAGLDFGTVITFAALDIAKGATITEAILDLTTTSSGQEGNTCNVNIYFHASDNSSHPANRDAADGLSLTAAVAWSSIKTLSAYEKYYSPDLKDILQAIVNRDGWESGNVVSIVIKDNGSSDYANRVGVGAYGINLVVDYIS